MAVLAAAFVTVSVASGGAGAGGSAGTNGRPGAGAVKAAGGSGARKAHLSQFRSCNELVRYARRHALETVKTGGYLGADGGLIRDMPALVTPGAELRAEKEAPAGALGTESPMAEAPPAEAPSVADQSQDPVSSGTNVQEAGVDEPDIVKSDGSWIFTASSGKLRAVDVRDGTPRVGGSLALEGSDHQLLLRGPRLLALSHVAATPTRPDAPRATDGSSEVGAVLLTEIDVSNPEAMRIVNTLKVNGAYVNARLHDATARVVISSSPQLVDQPLAGAEGGARKRGRRLSTAAGARAAIRRSRISTWRPSAIVRKGGRGRGARRPLVGCDSVSRPAAFSGVDMLTVLTIDLTKGVTPIDSDAVMTGAETVYASGGSLYVATERAVEPQASADRIPPATSTAIHKFDVSDPAQTTYRASGQVQGYLLSQWSLSERGGFLRAASSERPAWWEGADGREGESFVTVLEERSGQLVQVGRVGGIGRGERIYAVRFIDDVGYVVTFRETDPLFTIDLATPTAPRVLGELKLRGYSAYLHPVGENLLLGIGQDATDEGVRQGTQLSLFDVSNPGNPVRLHQRTLTSSSSEVEYDHHAFLWWAQTGLAVLPVQTANPDGTGASSFAGAIGFRIHGERGIDEVGRIEHDAGANAHPVRRALVVGDRLYTVSDLGVRANRLDTLDNVAWTPFG